MTEITIFEALNDLSDKIKTILSEKSFSASMEVVESKHLIGEEIVKSPLYDKWKKGNGDLIKELSVNTGHSESDLYYCVQFYNKYPDFPLLVETFAPENKGLSWNKIRASLSEPKDCDHVWSEEEKVIKYETCQKCGKKRNIK